MHRKKNAIAGLLLAFLFGPRALSAETHKSRRIELKSSIVAHIDSVSIADLLPDDTPEAMRDASRQIHLGEAPSPGEHRVFDRTQILRALRTNSNLQESLIIPDRVEVTRWSRLLTREDVLSAVEKTLQENRWLADGSLKPSDVIMDSPVAISEDAPKLKVTSVETARNGAGTRVRLWISSEPRLPPFWVALARKVDFTPSDAKAESAGNTSNVASERRLEAAARIPANTSAPSGTSTRAASPEKQKGYQPKRITQTAQAISPEASSSERVLIVKPGFPVQLIVQGSGMTIMTTGTALSSGRHGESIRVRNSLTGKVLVGIVVGIHAVQVDF